MKRYKWRLSGQEAPAIHRRLQQLAAHQDHFLFLDSHQHTDPYGRYKWLCGWGARESLSSVENSWQALRDFHNEHSDWCLGHLAFDLKNESEALSSQHTDHFDYPHLHFFVPEHLIYESEDGLFCESYSLQNFAELEEYLPPDELPAAPVHPDFAIQLSQNDYVEAVQRLRAHLQAGDIYEINFCLELLARGAMDTAAVFARLNALHRAPFSAFYRLEHRSLLCFSPERYLQKRGHTLTAQPIKGTAPRWADPEKDRQAAASLRASEKERAENVMIVDLMRNDLSRTAAPASVRVPELFGVYTFEAVHQMISTVQSRMREDCHFTEVLATTFPMGSMTGAPKHSALKLIDQYEKFNRGLYSGSLGYITPTGDFDFNVVIRSILHDQRQRLSSLRVGSAITIHCQPDQEYEECLLKAEKLMR